MLRNTIAKQLRCIDQSVISYVVNHVLLFLSAQGTVLLQVTLKLKHLKAFTIARVSKSLL